MGIRKAEVLERLRDYIDTVAPFVGDKLPAERQLAADISCSRETLRAALAVLQAEGELWRHVGQGTFRGSRPIARPVRDMILLEATTPLDLMEARVLLEPPVSATAALRRVDDDLVLLNQRVDACRKARDRSACERADDAFHQTIAHVARNPVLIALLRYFSGARYRPVWQREWDRTYRRLGVNEFTETHSEQHSIIVGAIADRDANAAQVAMATHLEIVSKAMRVTNQ
ncbi:MAG: FadR/GntR family transcriptional regulator [Sulfitobacter sp.]|jgi:DNA-binding FadR family transcriptional regulator|uniref:FadR/GntR family transcriptional regulator n=1 Tax=Sulfitobacter sp. TaxID=1903071 RepID=UPI0040589772|tara:strand:+ start:17021 stop:17707 length:687 start_codon:yes stop_codon:yes gene_type:complete